MLLQYWSSQGLMPHFYFNVPNTSLALFYWMYGLKGKVVSAKKSLLNIYSFTCHPRCRWVCFFIQTDFKIFSITSHAHQWILCREWVPSEWESKQLIKTSQSTTRPSKWCFINKVREEHVQTINLINKRGAQSVINPVNKIRCVKFPSTPPPPFLHNYSRPNLWGGGSINCFLQWNSHLIWIRRAICTDRLVF